MDVHFELISVPVEDGENIIVGKTHFIKSTEDIYETIVQINPEIKFGLAFNEASGERLVRTEGNSAELIQKATKAALKVGVGHSFYIYLKNGWPMNILNALRNVSELISIEAATANPLQIVVSVSEQGRGIVSIIDGSTPLGVETDENKKQRREFLRKIGYKL